MALNSSKIHQRMLTGITLNDLLEDWTASTEENLVSFELSLIIRNINLRWSEKVCQLRVYFSAIVAVCMLVQTNSSFVYKSQCRDNERNNLNEGVKMS